MKRFLLILALCSSALLFATDPAEGYWKSMDGKKASGYWYIYVENNQLYGICLIAPKYSPDVILDKCTREYPNHPNGKVLTNFRRKDVPIVYGLRRESEGIWRDGNVIDSRNGRFYICHISFKSPDGKKFKTDTLVFRGETKLGFGKTVYWHRASVEELNKAMEKNISERGSDYAKKNPQEFFVKAE